MFQLQSGSMLHPLDCSCIWNIASSDQILKLHHHSVPAQDQSPLPLPLLYKYSEQLNTNLWVMANQLASAGRCMVQFGSNLCGHTASAVAHLYHLNTLFNPNKQGSVGSTVTCITLRKGKDSIKLHCLFLQSCQKELWKGNGIILRLHSSG